MKHNTPISSLVVGFIFSSLLSAVCDYSHMPMQTMQKAVRTLLTPWCVLCQQGKCEQCRHSWCVCTTQQGGALVTSVIPWMDAGTGREGHQKVIVSIFLPLSSQLKMCNCHITSC